MSDIPKRIAELTREEKRDMLARLLARKAKTVDVPLSYAQQRLWFLDQLAPGSAFYNMPIALRLRMPLDVSALIRTLNEIVGRHEALRTTFTTRDGRPVQVIASQISLTVREIDLQHLQDTDRDAEARHLATAESRRPFDLTRGPLIRAGLLRLGPQDHVLLLTLHHIIADGWSLGVLFQELSTLYAAFAAGRPSPLPDLPIQFADYASWQRHWLEGPVLQEQMSYWRRQLDMLPELVLPTDRPRPAIATFRGARRFFTIAEDILRPVEELSRQTGTTLFMVLLAVFQVLLFRYSGQEDFPVGVPIANRIRKETEGLIGFFVNTLVLRADLSHDPTFREVLARVRETALSAYEHQDLPFERLVEELHPARDAARIPLIQVMFALQNAHGGAAGLGEPPIEMVEVERGTANFDLVLDLWEQDRALGGRIEFSTDLFDPDTIERLLDHFRTLLAAVALDANEHVSALPLMSDLERQRVLAELSDAEIDYPTDTPLSRLFEAQASATPHSTALCFDCEALTYDEVNARANQIAHCLHAMGIGAGDLVAMHLERSAGFVLAVLGILKAGAAYVPLDVSYPQARLAAMLSDADPRAVITTRALASSLPDVDVAVVFLDDHAAMRPANSDNLPSTRTGGDPAYVMYTSGSTGAPKGIVVPHRAVSRLVRKTNYIEIGPADRIAQASNVSFDASTFEIWGALLNGAQLVGVPKEVVLSPTELPAYLHEHGITTLFLTTALFNQIARTCPDAFRDLKHLLFGGEIAEARWVREVLAHGAPERLLHVYGPTESTTFATWHLVHHVEPGASTVAIGRPVTNTTAYVLDRHGQPVPMGVAGELHLGGPGLALGYLRRPELTDESFISSPFGRLYRTGDLVRIRADRTLEFVARRDSQVKIRGHRVEPSEIESTLMRHPALCDVTVVARDGHAGDKGLAAYVVLDRPAPIGAGSEGDDWVREWRRVYDEVIYDGVHDHPIARQNPLFNIAGWTSSYTGQPISPEEMREQVDQTVEQILALAPAEVLEIGCGTGLLLFKIAPSTQRYLATDFSRPALDYVGRQLATKTDWPVTLLERRADDFSGFEDQRFDLVILNSVIQYFPHADYLLLVLKSAASVLKPGGTILVGDVRSLPLLDAFHTAVELHQAPGSSPLDDLRARVRRRVAAERELVVAPQFFVALRDELSQITDVTVQPKRGRRHNELSRFRYDVHLRAAPSSTARSSPAVRDWCGHELSVQMLRHELLTGRPDVLCIERVPNARTAREVEALRLLDAPGSGTVGALRLALDRAALVGVDPEDLWALSDDVPYVVEISWARGWPDGACDVVFRRAGTPRLETYQPIWNPASALTNHPNRAASSHALITELRTFLQGQLPEYMIPAAFVVLDRLPLTANGKVDVRALPAPDTDRPTLDGNYVAPRTALERVLVGHWESVLGLERVGVTDSFFDLGGHSLVATQLVARIQATLRVPLALRTLFSKPTVADLSAALLAEAGPGQRLERMAALVLAVAEMPEDEAATLLAERTKPASPGSPA